MDELAEIATKILLRQNSKFLRDFREIQSQRNPRDRVKTVAALESVCKKSIAQDLWKLTKYELSDSKTDGLYWYSKIFDGQENFTQGVPLYSSMLSMVCDDSVKFAMINLPSSSNLIYVEPECGARSDDGGLYRVSNSTDLSSCIATSVSELKLTNKRDFLNNTISYLYTCMGNISGFVLELDEIEAKVAELLMNETGGKFSKIGKLSIGSNGIIHNQLREVVMAQTNLSSSIGQSTISFCCGPTQKPAVWSSSIYDKALIAQSHCSEKGIERIKWVQELIRSVMEIPKDYKVLLMNGSATGALECAFYNLLGHNDIQNFAFDVFGRRWAGELEIMIENLKKYTKNYPFLRKMHYNIVEKNKGDLPHETQFDPKSDLVLVYTGTSTGHVWNKHILSQPKNKDRVVIVDATSAAFVEDLPWESLDAVAFSFQKILGCEAGLGCLVLSPTACDLIAKRKGVFLAPRILRLTEDLITKIADEGKLINTISMLNLHEAYNALSWAARSGGLKFLQREASANQAIIYSKMTDDLEFLIQGREMRAKALLCLRPSNPKLQTWEFINKVTSVAEKNGVISISGHPEEAPCWRFWTGPSMSRVDEGFDKFLKSFGLSI